jgi:hypothetical protein
VEKTHDIKKVLLVTPLTSNNYAHSSICLPKIAAEISVQVKAHEKNASLTTLQSGNDFLS